VIYTKTGNIANPGRREPDTIIFKTEDPRSRERKSTANTNAKHHQRAVALNKKKSHLLAKSQEDGIEEGNQFMSKVVDPVIPLSVALIVTLPELLAVARPPPLTPLLIVAKLAEEVLQ
jgi:hypothetical protein